MKRRITVFTRETFERVILPALSRPASRLCGECGGRMVTPEEASRLSSVSARSVYRLAEAGQVHFAETPDGLLLVCTASL